jgi:AcrR family transcriptional regulator
MGITERKEREREQRRNAILDAAEEVFFSKGIENATMDEVAVAAELSKGTLYLYFKNKNEMLHGIVGRGLEILLDFFKKAVSAHKKGLDKVKALGEAYSEFHQGYPDHFALMLHRETRVVDPDMTADSPNLCRCNELGDKIFALMQEAVAVGVEDGTIRQDLDPFKLSLVLWGHTSGILTLARAKQPIIENIYGLKVEEIIGYSHQLIGEYLRNREHDK